MNADDANRVFNSNSYAAAVRQGEFPFGVEIMLGHNTCHVILQN